MRIGFVGMGNMGTALANLTASNGHDVLGWEYDRKVVDEINAKRANSRFLPGAALNSRVAATSDIKEVFAQCSVVFIAIPSRFVRPTLAPLKGAVNGDVLLINLAKGIEKDTYLTSYQVLEQLFPDNGRIMLSGPSIANELASCSPTMVVLAGTNKADLMLAARLLDSSCFRTRLSDDETGAELGGVLKNMYAIGLGLFDGFNIQSINFRSVYLTLALEEMARLGVKLGARRETFYYIAGLGDLLATSMSSHSHNRRLGEFLAHGMSVQDIEKKMGVMPEGYTTLQSVLYIAEKNHVSMPMAKALWDVLCGRYETRKFIDSFMRDFTE